MPERKDLFDSEIVKLSKVSTLGYEIENRKYKNYLNNSAWKDFLNELDNKYHYFYKNYTEGDGDELKEKCLGKAKTRIPPKMASIASSSRFVYLALRNNYFNKIKSIEPRITKDGAFRFEDKLKIERVGSEANLDASYKTKDFAVYFEAKCHEPFDNHELQWKIKYFGDFTNSAFFGNEKTSLGVKEEDVIKDEAGKPKLFAIKKGKEKKYALSPKLFNLDKFKELHLDVKQFVCHLLGVASNEPENRELIYLYFKPKSLKGFEDIYSQLEEEFKAFSTSPIIANFCKRNKIDLRLVYVVNDSILDETEFEIKQYYEHNH